MQPNNRAKAKEPTQSNNTSPWGLASSPWIFDARFPDVGGMGSFSLLSASCLVLILSHWIVLHSFVMLTASSFASFESEFILLLRISKQNNPLGFYFYSYIAFFLEDLKYMLALLPPLHEIMSMEIKRKSTKKFEGRMIVIYVGRYLHSE